MLCLHKALLKTKGEEEVAISTVAPERKRKPHIPHTTIPHSTSLRFALLRTRTLGTGAKLSVLADTGVAPVIPTHAARRAGPAR